MYRAVEQWTKAIQTRAHGASLLAANIGRPTDGGEQRRSALVPLARHLELDAFNSTEYVAVLSEAMSQTRNLSTNSRRSAGDS